MFTIYRSSAGSGKTYTLAQDYVALALLRPDYFKHILAVTFTNKATQEMKERILKFLHELAHGNNDQVAKEMMNRLSLTSEEVQHNAHAALQMMLHQYGRIAIKTIDSFFQQVLRSFTRELGLRGDFELELNSAKVEEAAIDRLLQDVGKDDWLTRWLVDYVLERVDEGKNYNVVTAIRELAKELHKEKMAPYLPQLFVLAEHPQVVSDFRQKLFVQLAGLKKEATGLGQEALHRIEKKGFTVNDFFYSNTGVYNAFAKWAKGDLQDLNSTRVLNAYHEGAWTKKAQPNRDAVQAFAEAELKGLLGQMLAFCEEKLITYNSLLAISQNLYVFGIMLKLMAKINAYKQDEDVLLLADTPDLIQKIIGDNPTPYIYEKVGTRFQHYLMDEFQDTSGLQWANMRPLVENALAAGHKGLVVGDIKQSIYRWRGGDWKLLLEQIEQDLGANRWETKDLDTNWRSLRNVVHFNNELYGCYPQHLQALLQPIADTEASIITQAYAKVDQKLSSKADEKENHGLVRFRFFDPKEENEEGAEVKWREYIPDLLIEALQEAQDAGFALWDIAILVRSNRDGNALIQFLQEFAAMQESKHPYNYDVISKEALALGDAPVIQCLTRAMALLQAPQNALLMVSLASAYSKLHPQHAEVPLLSPEASWSLLPEAFTAHMDELHGHSLFELAEKLMVIFELRVEGQLPYLQAFEDAILSFQGTQVADLQSFLDWWEEQGQHKSVMISDEQNAIRVLSIHKSKGLQFPVVILPYVDWSLDHFTGGGMGTILWTNEASGDLLKTTLNGLNLSIPVPIKYASGLQATCFAPHYRAERVQVAMDALNMLYVATTRAESVLLAFAPKPPLSAKGEEQAPKNVGALLYKVMQAEMGAELTDDQWERGAWPQGMGSGKKGSGQNLPLQHFHIQAWQERLQIKTRHQRLSYSGKQVDRIAYGNLIHDLLAEVRYASDIDAALDKLQMEGRIHEEQKQELKGVWLEMLNNPLVSAWYHTKMEVRNESQILTPEGSAYRPDRVMLSDSHAIVVDFKTGSPHRTHHQQLIGYMDILRAMGYAQVEAYLLYTDTMEIQTINPEA